jgi:hypothetical protein
VRLRPSLFSFTHRVAAVRRTRVSSTACDTVSVVVRDRRSAAWLREICVRVGQGTHFRGVGFTLGLQSVHTRTIRCVGVAGCRGYLSQIPCGTGELQMTYEFWRSRVEAQKKRYIENRWRPMERTLTSPARLTRVAATVLNAARCRRFLVLNQRIRGEPPICSREPLGSP